MIEGTRSTIRAWQGVELHESWKNVLGEEFGKEYMQDLWTFLQEGENRTVYPEDHKVFAALNATPFNEVKVVIIGQDPYHGGQADGLCFSVRPGEPLQPSLANILHEVNCDMGHDDVPCGQRNRTVPPGHGCLIPWARQGVLLLNAVLTVAKGCADSHKGKGWEKFTDRVVRAVSKKCDPVVFILWGQDAQEKCRFVDKSRHCVLKAYHPAPKAAWRGFFGCHHFSKTNRFLVDHGREPINWFNVKGSGNTGVQRG